MITGTIKKLQLPVLVSMKKDGTAQVWVPDLKIHVDGDDMQDALASATLIATQMYRYYLDHGIKHDFTTTYTEVEQHGLRRRGYKSIATFITLDW